MRPADVLGIAGLASIWGSGFLFTEAALAGLTAAQIVLVRLFVGGSLLLMLSRARRAALPRDAKVLGRLLLMGLIGQAVPWLLFALGQQEVTSSLAGVYTGATPLLTIPVTVVMLQGRPSRAEVTATAVGFVGLLVVFSPWLERADASLRGQILCLLGALCYAIAFGYVGRLLRDVELPKVSLAAVQALLAGVVMVPVTGRAASQTPRLTAAVVLAALTLAVGTAAAFLINYWLISRVGPVRASLAFYLLPVVALVLGIAVLGEQLTGTQALGTATILAALAWLYLWERRSATSPPRQQVGAGHRETLPD